MRWTSLLVIISIRPFTSDHKSQDSGCGSQMCCSSWDDGVCDPSLLNLLKEVQSFGAVCLFTWLGVLPVLTWEHTWTSWGSCQDLWTSWWCCTWYSENSRRCQGCGEESFLGSVGGFMSFSEKWVTKHRSLAPFHLLHVLLLPWFSISALS